MVFVIMDYMCSDQDNIQKMKAWSSSIPAFVSMSKYLIVLEKGVGEGSALNRAFVRLELFVARALWAAGVYTAAYVGKLRGHDSLQGMTLELIPFMPIEPSTYMVSDYKTDQL